MSPVWQLPVVGRQAVTLMTGMTAGRVHRLITCRSPRSFCQILGQHSQVSSICVVPTTAMCCSGRCMSHWMNCIPRCFMSSGASRTSGVHSTSSSVSTCRQSMPGIGCRKGATSQLRTCSTSPLHAEHAWCGLQERCNKPAKKMFLESPSGRACWTAASAQCWICNHRSHAGVAHQGEVHRGELLLIVRRPAALVARVPTNVFSAQLHHEVVSVKNSAGSGRGASTAKGHSPPVQQTGGSQWHGLLHASPASPAAARLLQESFTALF